MEARTASDSIVGAAQKSGGRRAECVTRRFLHTQVLRGGPFEAFSDVAILVAILGRSPSYYGGFPAILCVWSRSFESEKLKILHGYPSAP